VNIPTCNGCIDANALTPGALCVPCVEAAAREAISVRLAEQAITIAELKATSAGGATCGTNPLFPPERLGCGRPIATCAEVYRCVDCSTPFHISCIKAHFASEVTGVGSCSEADRLRDVLKGFAEHDCAYGDGCPVFGGRHGRCTSCIAREALGSTLSVSPDVNAMTTDELFPEGDG